MARDKARNPEDLLAWRLCMELGTYVAESVSEGPVARDFKF
jgi:hypothetical protein